MLRAEGRLEELIEKMIEFSMEASGHFTIQTKPTDLSQIIQDVLRQASGKAEKRTVILESDLGIGACIVKVDQEKIQWVIMELLENAIKFTPPNGSVKVGLNWTDEVAQFYVLDTGIGIASERLAEIFEPYHQLDSSSTRQYGGIGLGLALVKKIIEAHGSNIEVTSQIGRGTFIEFHLPICLEAA
jgi:signal transduction histidine kinase